MRRPKKATQTELLAPSLCVTHGLHPWWGLWEPETGFRGDRTSGLLVGSSGTQVHISHKKRTIASGHERAAFGITLTAIGTKVKPNFPVVSHASMHLHELQIVINNTRQTLRLLRNFI